MRFAADIESGIGSRSAAAAVLAETPHRSRNTQIQRLLLPRQLATDTGAQDRARVVSIEGRRTHARADIDGNAVNAKITLAAEITHRSETDGVGMGVEIAVSQTQSEVLARSQSRCLHRHGDGRAGSQLGDFRECRPAVGCKVALAVGGDQPQRPALPVFAHLRIDAGRLIGLARCTQYDLIVRGRCGSRANRGRVRIRGCNRRAGTKGGRIGSVGHRSRADRDRRRARSTCARAVSRRRWAAGDRHRTCRDCPRA